MRRRLLTEYTIIMLQFLAWLRKIKLRAADNHSYMCHICTKGFLYSNFNFAVINKILNFHEIAQKFTKSQKS